MKRPDPFLVSLIGAILIASFLPCPAEWQSWLSRLTSLLVMMMFFFQGAKLQRHSIVESMQNWKLQGSTILVSFVLFPILGCILFWIAHLLSPNGFFGNDLWNGILFLCCLPSTIQSSIALTSIARGNVPASICAATVSNILGIVFTPLLSSLFFHRSGGGSGLDTILDVSRELLLPFILGQFAQRWVGPIVKKHKILLSFTDRGSIIILVYAAFSTAVLQGLWHRVPVSSLIAVSIVDTILLALALTGTALLGRFIGQPTEDDISLQFCGSKKSLASGVPMASVIFSGGAGIIVLPLMLFHQIQLFVCTIMARRYAERSK